MPVYVVIRKSDQTEVYRYDAPAPIEWGGMEFADFDHIEQVPPVEPSTPPVTVFGGRRRVTKLEFVQLIGDQAYGAVLMMAKQSIQVEALVKMIDLATPEQDGTSINLDDQRTQSGVQQLGAALQQVGAVPDGAAWAEGVLRG